MQHYKISKLSDDLTVPFFGNLWTSLDLPLINLKIGFGLSWSKNGQMSEMIRADTVTEWSSAILLGQQNPQLDYYFI